MQALTIEQMQAIAAEHTSHSGDPVRFMHAGRSVNIVTGEYASERGANVMYHLVYWKFDRETARIIAGMTGTRPAFDTLTD